jgi:3-dehydroquinate synthase
MQGPAGGVARTTHVALGARSYDILVGAGLLAQADSLVAPMLGVGRACVVTDETVARLHLPVMTAALARAGVALQTIVLPPGEQTKSFAQVESLSDRLLAAKIERGDTLIALGGGVIGDLTGFLASITLRGIGFLQVPTTLLAQVDSSVGGKTGINTKHGKNLIGSFYQPRLVLADVGLLDTLPSRELRAGYAEVVKYGLLGDAEFFAWLERHGAALLAGDVDARIHAVTRSCEAKAAIVAADEREGGVRALLNLGHTFGHALETATGYSDRLLHGESVAIGTVLAFELSARLGLCPPDDARRVRAHLQAVGLPTGPADIAGGRLDPDALIAAMAHDKKVAHGRVRFVLARGIGRAFLTDAVESTALRALLAEAVAA